MVNYCRGGQATGNNIIRRMRIACWVPKATNTHSEYVILIAFPLQQWLHERTSMLRYSTLSVLVMLSVRRHLFSSYIDLLGLFFQERI